MKRLSVITAGLLVVAFSFFGCSSQPSGSGWVTLVDGDKGLENFNRIGDANWRAEGGAIVADKGKGGHLVTKNTYKDFEIYAEFYAETSTNSGIFMRVSDPKNIVRGSAYEANIYDLAPEKEYGTGSITTFASVPVPTIYKAGGKWNTFEIYAKGPEVTVKLNGVVTVSLQNDKYASGPFSLQFNPGAQGAPGGVIKWRKVMIKPL